MLAKRRRANVPNTSEEDLKKQLADAKYTNQRAVKILTNKGRHDEHGSQPYLLNLDEDTLTASEYIPVEEPGTVKARQGKWLVGESDEESEEEFKWIDTLSPEEEAESTYFTFINQTREVMRAGTQAWNCYGNRTNQFLLVNYGFCFKDNLYDSFKLRPRLDLLFSKKKQFTVAEILQPAKDLRAVQEIRLKKHCFSDLLMAYMRSSLKEDFYRNNDSRSIPAAEISDLDFEKHCLDYYLAVV